MPLHLLGKKSWNVYSSANIERVRRDEAEAQRLEAEREERQRQDEAGVRLAALKGDPDRKGAPSRQNGPDQDDVAPSTRLPRGRKRRLPGEDDTDRDIRLAREVASRPLSDIRSRANSDHPLVDQNGHIAPIPQPTEAVSHEKPRPGLEKDPYTVYLTDATGRGKNSNDSAWYTKTPGALPAKEEWDNDRTRRDERESARMAANDPLAAMKRGVKQLREAEKARHDWMIQRERDLHEVEEFAAKERRRRRRHEKERRRDRHDRPREGRASHESDHRKQGASADTAGQHPTRTGKRPRSPQDEAPLPNDDDLGSLDGFDLDAGYRDSRPDQRHSRSHRPATSSVRRDRDREREPHHDHTKRDRLRRKVQGENVIGRRDHQARRREQKHEIRHAS